MHFEVEAGKTYNWCSCGMSKTQPLCDGAHKGTDMRPLVYKADVSKKVTFCMCKQSGNKPFCDGTHIKVFARMHGAKVLGLGAVGAIGGVAAYKFLF